MVMLLGIEAYIYRYAGIKQYREVVRKVKLLPDDLRDEAMIRLVDDGTYGGAVMRVSTIGRGGVWVWGSKGPKFFRASIGSAFSYYSMCDREYLLKRLEKGESIKPERRVYGSVKLWKEKVKPGDYVVVVRENEGRDSDLGGLREVWAYDWWPFLSVDLKEWCSVK